MKTIKELPSTVTKVNIETGSEETQPISWKIIPPSPDKCQVCGRDHKPKDPHDPQSIFYQTTFQSMIGRPPTWADALAHCGETTKKLWTLKLKQMKYWSEPPNGEEPVKHHGVE